MKPDYLLSVVVPVFNEEDILWETAESLARLLDKCVGPKRWQYVLVDNGSRDRSPEIIWHIAEQWPQTVTLELRSPNYGAALRVGLRESSAVWAHIINVDFWDPDFLAWAWKQRINYDLILGSKRADPALNGQTRYRRLLSWGLNSILGLLFEFVGADTHGPKLLKLSAMQPLFDQCVMERGQFDTEFTLRALRSGLRVAEMPIAYSEKRPNRNWMIRKIAWNLRDMIRLRREIQAVPWSGPLNYHRWSHADLDIESAEAEPQHTAEKLAV